jgi:carbamoyltransferase
MQATMNLKIKFRESFRPFAPAVMREHVSEYFELDYDSPYMLLVAPVSKNRRVTMTAEQEKLFGIAKLNVPKSDLPAVTHVDYSARIQTVTVSQHPTFYKLLAAFKAKTGCPVLVNTSFNVRGEPIVCTPADAYACFMRTNMDALVIGNIVMLKEEQPKWQEREDWRTKFELD